MAGVVEGRFGGVYADKRVLVTGDTGFKGSWLSLWLKTLGADVVGYALPPVREEDHFSLLALDKTIHHIDGDIRDRAALIEVFQKFQPEFLFHLAAQALVKVSYEDPKLTFDTNIGGGVNILETVRTTKSLRSVVYVTSDKCYKNKEWVWGYRENDELGGKDPYSASKAAAELVFSAYEESFFRQERRLGAASVRAGNVIGGGDWSPNRIVPDCIRALQSGTSIILRNPESTRPWQHVLDPLSGYLMLAAAMYERPGMYSGGWNFGPDDKSIRTVKDLASRIVEHWGGGGITIVAEDNPPYEARLLHLNCDKARRLISWRPNWDFAEAAAETARWYKEVFAGKRALDVSLSQIERFQEGGGSD